MITFGPWSSSFIIHRFFCCRGAQLLFTVQIKCKANVEPSSLELCWAAAFIRCASQMHSKGTKKFWFLQEFLGCRATVAVAWFSSDWRNFCFRPLEGLLPPIGKPKTARRAPRNYFCALTFFNKIRAYPPAPPEGMGASMSFCLYLMAGSAMVNKIRFLVNKSRWNGQLFQKQNA